MITTRNLVDIHHTVTNMFSRDENFVELISEHFPLCWSPYVMCLVRVLEPDLQAWTCVCVMASRVGPGFQGRRGESMGRRDGAARERKA